MKRCFIAILSVLILLSACDSSEEDAKIVLAEALQTYDQAINAPDAAGRLAGLSTVQTLLDQLVADYPTSEVGLKLAAKEIFGQLVPAELAGMIATAEQQAEIETCLVTVSAYCILVTAAEVQVRAFDVEFDSMFAAIPDRQKILARILDANVAALDGDQTDPATLSDADRIALLADLLIRGHDDKFINFLTAYPQAESVNLDLNGFIDAVENKPRLMQVNGALGLPVIGAMGRLTADYPDELARLSAIYAESRRADDVAATAPSIEEIREEIAQRDEARRVGAFVPEVGLLVILGRRDVAVEMRAEYQPLIDQASAEDRFYLHLSMGEFEDAVDMLGQFGPDDHLDIGDPLSIGILWNGGIGDQAELIATLIAVNSDRRVATLNHVLEMLRAIGLLFELPVDDTQLLLNAVISLDSKGDALAPRADGARMVFDDYESSLDMFVFESYGIRPAE